MSDTSPPSSNTLTAENSRPTVHLDFLDGMRGLAALYVVFHHYLLWNSGNLPRWANYLFGWSSFGHFGVDLFITLSGFCLMLPVARTADGELRGGFSGYMRRRAQRILPPYYGALVIAIIVAALTPEGQAALRGHPDPENTWTFTAGNIVSHLFLFHNLSIKWLHSLDLPMWSIATEWQIYFVFALLLLPVWRKFGGVATIATGTVLGLAAHFALPAGNNFDGACPWYIALFAFGMIAAVWAETTTKRAESTTVPVVVSAVILAVALIALRKIGGPNVGDNAVPLEWQKDFVCGGLSVCMILFCYLAAHRDHTLRQPFLLRLCKSKVAVGLGAFSYSIYLVHCIVLVVVEHVAKAIGLSDIVSLFVRFAFGIPLALGASYLFYIAFERPFLVKRAKPVAAILPAV